MTKLIRSRWQFRRLPSKPINRIRENQNHKTTWLKSHVTLRSEPLAVSHQADKFGNNKHCGKSYLLFLICHVISHNHSFKWSCDFIVGIPSPLLTTLLLLVVSGIVLVKIKCFWFVTWSQKTTCLTGYVTLRVETLHSKSPPRHIYYPGAFCSKEKTYLICHMTSYDHVSRGLCDFMHGNPS